MTNSDKFKQVFGLYATELWAMTETEFLAWLNADAEPKRKTGRWILVNDINGQHYVCEFCGEWKYHQKQKICGECGAKMEVEHETD